MQVRKFAVTDATLERSPGQEGDVFVGNVIDHRDDVPISIGYGRYAPHQSLEEAIRVHDVVIVLEGRLSVTSSAGTVTAGPGEIIHLPAGERVTITTDAVGALTAYVTHPHWEAPEA